MGPAGKRRLPPPPPRLTSTYACPPVRAAGAACGPLHETPPPLGRLPAATAHALLATCALHSLACLRARRCGDEAAAQAAATDPAA